VKKKFNMKLRIGLLVTSVEFGGLEVVVKGLIEHIDRETFDITPIIFTANRQKERTLVSELQESGRRYYNIIVDAERVKYMNPIKNIRQVYNIFREHQFDLIHTHGYRADVLGFMAASPLRVPLVATCHGFIRNDKKLLFYTYLDKIILKRFNRVIAVSSEIATTLIKGGIKERNISIVPNAVDLNHDKNGIKECRSMTRASTGWYENHFVLGYIGRLSEEKGVRVLLEAVSSIVLAGVPVQVAIIGEGSQRACLESMSRTHGMENVVKFLGFQRNIQSWLPSFDAFILPSLTEGTPMAMLEAMLYGLPVVATAVGGIPDIIKSGRNGILVRPGNARDISEAVCLLFKDQKLRDQIGTEARVTVQTKYNVKNWIKKMEDEYRKVVAG